MKIRDIVNRDLVNLTNCEHEPIHIPGSIQPHGFLIAVKKSDWRVEFCSANVFEFIGLRHDQVLTKTLREVIGELASTAIINFVTTIQDNATTPLVVDINNVKWNLASNNTDDLLILEFEPYEVANTSLEDFYTQTRDFIRSMEKASNLQTLCQLVAEQTRAITGYDRVMIYRFDKEYNGEVFAESKREDLEPFLGLHYPHTDIPAQARELYKKNLLRLIVDVKYKPVPIYTIDDSPNKNLDLGNCALRSVSPIHIQYLSNIGVSATLTVSLLHEGNLWGLIACHHYSSAKYISSRLRNASSVQGHFITSQINVRQIAERNVYSQTISVALEKMLSLSLPEDRSKFKAMIGHQELLDLCHATGVALFIEENLYTAGEVPKHEDSKKIFEALKLKKPFGALHYDKLLDLYPDAAALREVAAGALYHRFEDARNIGIIWFRRETISEVHWAGDPEKAIIQDESGLHPRKSFGLWKQVVQFKSMPWQEAELAAASTFARNLQRHTHLLFIREEQNKSRQLNEILKKANLELENMNWIGTHDLKEPLRKIKLFASRVLTSYGETLNETVIDSITKMSNAADRMQKLIGDLLEYSKVRNNSEAHIDVDLNKIVAEVVKILNAEEEPGEFNIVIEKLPNIKGVRFLLVQLFTNLLRNAIKFKKEDVRAEISITASTDHIQLDEDEKQLYYRVSIQDNGIGFENEYNETIFKVFTRLHTIGQYPGTGIGLALCQKVMSLHGGMIKAEGNVNQGARFDLYFPA